MSRALIANEFAPTKSETPRSSSSWLKSLLQRTRSMHRRSCTFLNQHPGSHYNSPELGIVRVSARRSTLATSPPCSHTATLA